MNYSPQDLKQGLNLKIQSEETPNSFGVSGGAPQREVSPSFGKSRMAGQKGERIMSMLTDPVEAQRTMEWMDKFGMSNQGYEFNQAKMMMAAPPEAAPQEEQA